MENKSNICSVHNIEMEIKKLKIEYGMPLAPVVGYEEDREQYFPNCDDYLMGGCEENLKKSYSNEYVCKLCNETRDEWKENHRSEIFFHIFKTINENIVFYLNENIKYKVKKDDNRFNEYWVEIIAIPNGKYTIFAKDENTNVTYANIEVELNNKLLSLNLVKENDIITFQIDYISDMNGFWYD